MADEKLPALTDEWFSKPYEVLLEEAKRTGAYVGPGSHTTRWSPDTCGCVLDQISDGYLIRVIDGKQQIREAFVHDPMADLRAGHCECCECHAQFGSHENKQAHFECVLAENQGKNRFEAALRNLDGGKDIEYKWSFDAERKLVVDTCHCNKETATAIAALTEREDFAGKVIVNG